MGIIVGDAGSRALTVHEVAARQITDEFLRQNSSIHFVLVLSVNEEPWTWPLTGRTGNRQLHTVFAYSPHFAMAHDLELLFQRMLTKMPKPVMMPVNAQFSLKKPGYESGYHGGHEMSRDHVKISAREVMEVLAGRLAVQETNSLHRWSLSTKGASSHRMLNPFERCLREGRLPASVSLVKTDENEPDDWVEFEFEKPDPAITTFR